MWKRCGGGSSPCHDPHIRVRDHVPPCGENSCGTSHPNEMNSSVGTSHTSPILDSKYCLIFSRNHSTTANAIIYPSLPVPILCWLCALAQWNSLGLSRSSVMASTPCVLTCALDFLRLLLEVHAILWTSGTFHITLHSMKMIKSNTSPFSFADFNQPSFGLKYCDRFKRTLHVLHFSLRV